MRITFNRLKCSAAPLETRVYLDGEDVVTISPEQTEQIQEVADRSSETNNEAGRIFDKNGDASEIVEGTSFNNVDLRPFVTDSTTQTVHSHPVVFAFEQTDGSISSFADEDDFNGESESSIGDLPSPQSPRDLRNDAVEGTDGFVVSGGFTFMTQPKANGGLDPDAFRSPQDGENLEQRIAARNEQDQRNAVLAAQSRDGNRADQGANAGSEDAAADPLTDKEVFDALLDGAAGGADVAGQTLFFGETGGNPDGSTDLTAVGTNFTSSEGQAT